MDCVTNFRERRGDDLELDASEHVLGFMRGRFIQRIRHRECRAGTSELDQADGAELAEAAWQLTYDRRLGGNPQ